MNDPHYMDRFPLDLLPWNSKGAPALDAGLFRHRYSPEVLEELGRLVRSLQGQVMARVIQAVTEQPAFEWRLKRLRSIAEGHAGREVLWRVLSPHVDEAERLGRRHAERRELRALMLAVFDRTRKAVACCVLAGATPARQAARLLIAERFAGVTRRSWEDLGAERHISERLLRDEMRALGLPSNHV